MKNLLLILVIVILVAPSCNRKAIEEELNQKNQELAKLASERDSILQQLSAAFEEFENTIGISDKQGELKERMAQSVEHLKSLLDENDRNQKSLQRRIAGSGAERNRLSARMLAAAIERCHERRYSYVTYGLYRYGNQRWTSLMQFKARHGFDEILIPRYHVPLSTKGTISSRFKLHRGMVGILPPRLVEIGRAIRARSTSGFSPV
jgi:hypothetical protein